MPNIIDWPAGDAFTPSLLRFGASTPKSAFGSLFTGQVQTVGHLADRLRCSITLPPCDPVTGAQREAFFIGRTSRGDLLRLGHLQRFAPNGTLGGSPLVAASALTGARSLQVNNAGARNGALAATVLAGDMLAVGDQLLMTDHPGATDSATGSLTIPLAVPLAAAVAAGAPVAWLNPRGTFQMVAVQGLDVEYGRGAWQRPLEVVLLQYVEA